MTEKNSTNKSTRSKPAKPYPEFPLFAHAAGVWAKKIRGKFHYFGSWDDPDAALDKYLKEKDALHAGRKPRPDPEGVVVKDLANAFLAHKQTLVDDEELSPRTWKDYKDACDEFVMAFGKQRLLADLGPDDFAELRNKMSKKWGPHRLAKMIQCVRSAFKYAFESEFVSTPIRYGPGFQRPSKKTIRINRAKQGPKLFTPEEIRKLIAAAGTPLKAMILLGINAGFGNSDCGTMPLSTLDLDRGWIDYARPKTGIPRTVPLWPETLQAVREALAKRSEPKDKTNANLVFITKYGQSWHKRESSDTPISNEMRKLLNRLEIKGRRNFYTLRHTFRTVADEARDQPAVDFLMGHESPHIASVYREKISDERLLAVTNYVRNWLVNTTENTKTDESNE